MSFRRDLLWLPGVVRRPARPSRDRASARPLLEAALSYSRGCLRGMFASSADPRAYRRYRLAGFSLHPRCTCPARSTAASSRWSSRCARAPPSDFDLMDSLDRQRRDAAHGVDHPLLASMLPTARDRPHHRVRATSTSTRTVRPCLLAATNRRTAQRLLWEALAEAARRDVSASATSPRPTSGRSTSALAARLSVSHRGLPGAARDEAADAVPAPRRAAVSA